MPVADIPPGEHHVVMVIDDRPVAATHNKSLFNPEGLWADQGTDISPDDINQARKEMWGKFAHEDSS